MSFKLFIFQQIIIFCESKRFTLNVFKLTIAYSFIFHECKFLPNYPCIGHKFVRKIHKI